MIKEFKEFVMKGNILDLAVAVIIGAAFKAVISSFVADILMPPIGVALGGVDFKDLAFVLVSASEGVDAVVLSYGKFIQTIIDFVIISFVIFMVVKSYNKLQRKKEVEPAPPAALSKQEQLLTEIRDALQSEK